MSRGFAPILCLLLLLSSISARAQNAVAYSLTPLGGSQYRSDFSFYNLGLEKDAIFKITIGQRSVSSNWITVLFEDPTGWIGSHRNGALDWITANGDITSASPGISRLWGQQGTPTGHGATSAEWRNVEETYTTSPVPEPAGILAFLSGLVGTVGLILRRRR